MRFSAIVLAAGRSSRFHRPVSKLLTSLGGVEVVCHVLSSCVFNGITTSIVVNGEDDPVLKVCNDRLDAPIRFFVQDQRMGTGDAFLLTRDAWRGAYTIVINGDTPLFDDNCIKEFCDLLNQEQPDVAIVAADGEGLDLTGYGRVFAESGGFKIIEDVDCTESQKEKTLINGGVYAFSYQFLQKHVQMLEKIPFDNEKNITSYINYAFENDIKMSLFQSSFDSVRGVNTLSQFSDVQTIFYRQRADYFIEKGVLFLDRNAVSIDFGVEIEQNVTIDRGVVLRGKTKVLRGTSIGAGCVLEDAIVGKNVTLRPHSVVSYSEISEERII
jgi:bifunctional UDP-N-acetylglucosamine pyrophosphorylase/glucosamine-1-phosphate N-acetyltransferase